LDIGKVISERISGIDWQSAQGMNEKGSTMVLWFLSIPIYLKTTKVERYPFRLGEDKYFKYPLTDLIQPVR
jgi:hypothetical protein